MIGHNILRWLGIVSSWYILVPLFLVILRWSVHDTLRRRVAWYVIFNFSFTLITYATARYINNIFIFYLASPTLVILAYRVFDAMVKRTAIWAAIGWIILAYCIFVAVDMIWLENFWVDFSTNIYPVEKSIIILMAYYFLYQFSKESRSDFSSFWIGFAIGINALFSLVLIVYTPHIGWERNTVGYFVWYGLGSIISLISYSMMIYGLWIAKPDLSRQVVSSASINSH